MIGIISRVPGSILHRRIREHINPVAIDCGQHGCGEFKGHRRRVRPNRDRCVFAVLRTRSHRQRLILPDKGPAPVVAEDGGILAETTHPLGTGKGLVANGHCNFTVNPQRPIALRVERGHCRRHAVGGADDFIPGPHQPSLIDIPLNDFVLDRSRADVRHHRIKRATGCHRIDVGLHDRIRNRVHRDVVHHRVGGRNRGLNRVGIGFDHAAFDGIRASVRQHVVDRDSHLGVDVGFDDLVLDGVGRRVRHDIVDHTAAAAGFHSHIVRRAVPDGPHGLTWVQCRVRVARGDHFQFRTGHRNVRQVHRLVIRHRHRIGNVRGLDKHFRLLGTAEGNR